MQSPACLWESGTSSSGKRGLPSRRGEELKEAVAEDGRKHGKELLALGKDAVSRELRMDYAVGLILTGNYEEAIKRLQDLENERPGQYEIAVNLGTALELAGQSSAALGWIKEGIRRNPYSHNATEWLHVMILEAQLKAATNKSLFRDKTLLGLTPEQLQGDDSRVIRIGNEQKSIAQIDSALHYQLQERLSLVKKKEPILAGLLMDAATMEATRRNLEEAIKILDLAEKYGYPSGTITHAKKKYRALIKNNKQAKEEL